MTYTTLGALQNFFLFQKIVISNKRGCNFLLVDYIGSVCRIVIADSVNELFYLIGTMRHPYEIRNKKLVGCFI